MTTTKVACVVSIVAILLGGVSSCNSVQAMLRAQETAATMCHVRGGIAVPSYDPDGQPMIACVRELEPK